VTSFADEENVKLTFIGTRGFIEAKVRRHRPHTSTLVSYRRRRILIDYGEDWRGRAGAPRPVYAIAAAWTKMERLPVLRKHRRTLRLRQKRRIEGIVFEPYSVVHSTRAPAVG